MVISLCNNIGYRLLITVISACKEGTHDCDANADCQQNTNSYVCICRKGFTGNGKTCTGMEGRKEGNVLFNEALNTFHLRLYGVTHMVKDNSDRVILYASSHRQDTTYHSLCYTSHGALAGTRNSSMGPPHEGSIR